MASVLFLTILGFGWSAVGGSDRPGLVVHEWGTFTSIAGEDGQAVQWLPLSASSDLPCFVERFGLSKASLPATVRMETPVLYFYSPHETTVDVTVRFKQGLITEWFPHAAVTPMAGSPGVFEFSRPGFSSVANWRHVTVAGPATTPFRDDHLDSRYYVARRTDASPVTVDSVNEKFLFYRGVAGFQPPIRARVHDDRIEMSSDSALGDVILFENHGGLISYRSIHSASTRATFDSPALDGESATPQTELQERLIDHGLYSAEAKAMVDTWRDSWFEEGRRLFYIVSRGTIDDVLPIDISPAPETLVRVFVGRIELVPARPQAGTSAPPRVCR